ncbi:MAG: AzlD domain-containing protein [Thermoplasmataceae archaeon]
MTEFYLIIAILAILSLLQRVFPWLVFMRVGDRERLNEFFTLFGISAFSALIVYDIQRISVTDFVPLIAAGLIAWRFRNVGVAVFSAILIELALNII